MSRLMDILPACMMPDGADPCAGYKEAMERIEELEGALTDCIHELDSWWRDQGDYGTNGYEKWIPELKRILKGDSK